MKKNDPYTPSTTALSTIRPEEILALKEQEARPNWEPDDVPEDDFEPDPALCEDPLQIFRDAKAGKRTFLDLLTDAERAKLLECIK